MQEKDRTTEGEDDLEAEVEAVRQNRELMEFLEERSRSEKTYTLEEVRKKLGLD